METHAVRQLFPAETESPLEGIRIGRVVRRDNEGRIMVTFSGAQGSEIAARVTTTVMQILCVPDPAGREVLLAFENNDPRLPVIIDTMHSILDEVAASTDALLEVDKPEDVLIDGRRITFDAQEEVVLRCGKASITLTRAGKVLIRGAYLSSRSSGVNRIKGGSVQIN